MHFRLLQIPPQIFDSNDDGLLDFEEFIMATSAKGDGSPPEEKLKWLFDNVYDKVGRLVALFLFSRLVERIGGCSKRTKKCRENERGSISYQIKVDSFKFSVLQPFYGLLVSPGYFNVSKPR